MTARTARTARTAAAAALILAAAVVGRTADPIPNGGGTSAPEGNDLAEKRRQAADSLLRGDSSSALLACGEVLRASPGDEGCTAVSVHALIAGDRWQEALDEARAFAASRSSSPAARSLLGEALYRAGRLAEAGDELAPLAASDGAPARGLAVLGLVRVASGAEDDGARLLDRALAAAPEDRFVVFWAAGAAPTRARTVELLERYLALSAGDDRDRIDGARGTTAIYRALGERPVWVPVNRPDRLELPLFALPGEGGRARGYLVEAVLGDGKPTRLLLDSGASGLFLLERIAAKRGFAPLGEETVFAGGGEGRHASKRGLLPTVSLGELRFKDALVTTTAKEIEPTGRYHGILGLSVFKGYRIILDLRAARLVLETPPVEPRGTPYWDVSGQMLVEGEVGEAGRGLFLFDSGASRSEVALAFADSGPKGRLGAPASVRGYGGEMPGARLVRGIRLAFPGIDAAPRELIAVDLTQRSRLGGVEIAGDLGLDLLDGHRIAVDTRSRRFEILPAK